MFRKLAGDGNRLLRGCVSVLPASAPSAPFSHGAYEVHVMAVLRYVWVQNSLVAMECLFALLLDQQAFRSAESQECEGIWGH